MRRTHGGPSGPNLPSKFDAGRFVAWDGEGGELPDDTTHRYFMLKNSAGGELVVDSGIPTWDALSYLTAEAGRLGKQVTHVCFGVSYDVNMMLGDLRRSQIQRLWKGDRVRVGRRFKIAYRARKTFWVKDYRTGASLTLWDPFGFYQTSFIKAVVKHLGPNDPRLPLIREGKRRRGSFRPADLPFIRTYTQAELDALIDLMAALRRSFIKVGLKLRRWDGAGAVAAALMDKHGIRAHMATCPDEVREAALFAYFGGRIETLRYGFHDGIIYHGDIRSAYPYGMTLLPSLSHGRWRHLAGGMPDEPFAVVKVKWDFKAGDRRSILPFPFRSSASAVFFPRKGVGWVWRPELDAALKWPDYRDRIKVLDGWEFKEDDPSRRPFSWIPQTYQDRLAFKAAHDAAEHPLKLGMNSGYGKLVQNVGGTADHPPPYHQLEWGGFITSNTRATLFDAAMRSDDGAITLATDGIYSTKPLPFLKVGEGLGEWDYNRHRRMVIAQSGVYFYVDSPAREGRCDKCGGRVEFRPLGAVRCVRSECRWTNLVEHYRGFDEDTLDPDIILSAWRRKATTVEARSTRFITMGRASLTDEGFLKWRTWAEEPRELEIHATGKRLDRIDPADWTRNHNPSQYLFPTDPADPFETESNPYKLAWAVEQGEVSADAQEQVSL